MHDDLEKFWELHTEVVTKYNMIWDWLINTCMGKKMNQICQELLIIKAGWLEKWVEEKASSVLLLLT